MTDTLRLFWGLILKSFSSYQPRSGLHGGEYECISNERLQQKPISIETQVSSGVWTLVNWEYVSEPGVRVCAWSWADCRSGCAQAGNHRVSEMVARAHARSRVRAQKQGHVFFSPTVYPSWVRISQPVSDNWPEARELSTSQCADACTEGSG